MARGDADLAGLCWRLLVSARGWVRWSRPSRGPRRAAGQVAEPVPGLEAGCRGAEAGPSSEAACARAVGNAGAPHGAGNADLPSAAAAASGSVSAELSLPAQVGQVGQGGQVGAETGGA